MREEGAAAAKPGRDQPRRSGSSRDPIPWGQLTCPHPPFPGALWSSRTPRRACGGGHRAVGDTPLKKGRRLGGASCGPWNQPLGVLIFRGAGECRGHRCVHAIQRTLTRVWGSPSLFPSPRNSPFLPQLQEPQEHKRDTRKVTLGPCPTCVLKGPLSHPRFLGCFS